ncbi:hypothetical protein, partial [Poseidonibacter ostreae]|uniref:hypothetical protein n=1 Tax=Poseidonibacter ostreae TaxID=2654171 RepID=UPI004032BEC4
QLNNLIKKKLRGFDKSISLEKLILLDYQNIKKLCDYIDKNAYNTTLKKHEKEYFYILYSRLKNVKFINDLEINVCPYCNRNYIFNFTKNNSKEATAQLDHFFDKKTYPYLAVSIFNLVPSCSTCNQRKSTKQENIFYPYEESFNQNAKFVYDGIKADFKNQKLDFFDEERIKLKVEILNKKLKVENHIEVFNIENLYEKHKDIVKELLQKRVIYSDSYIDELFSLYGGSVFSSREELLRLITCGYVSNEDINKRPLSKLIKDISEDLGMI